MRDLKAYVELEAARDIPYHQAVFGMPPGTVPSICKPAAFPRQNLKRFGSEATRDILICMCALQVLLMTLQNPPPTLDDKGKKHFSKVGRSLFQKWERTIFKSQSANLLWISVH